MNGPSGMSVNLAGRVAVVTGASAGIGEATAHALAAAGAGVVLNARRADRLEAVCAAINARWPGRAVAAGGDAGNEAVIERVLDAARSGLGREADLVVVNAGRGLKGSVYDSDPAAWEAMVRVNVLGAARLMRAAGRRMVESLQQAERARPAGGTPAFLAGPARDIIVIGSVVGRNVSPFSSMYGATKFAAHALAEGLRRELGPRGVRVTLVAPGFVSSEFQGVAGYDPAWYASVQERIGPALTPGDVAGVIAYVAAQPPGVHVAEVVVRPTRQDYP